MGPVSWSTNINLILKLGDLKKKKKKKKKHGSFVLLYGPSLIIVADGKLSDFKTNHRLPLIVWAQPHGPKNIGALIMSLSLNAFILALNRPPCVPINMNSIGSETTGKSR